MKDSTRSLLTGITQPPELLRIDCLAWRDKELLMEDFASHWWFRSESTPYWMISDLIRLFELHRNEEGILSENFIRRGFKQNLWRINGKPQSADRFVTWDDLRWNFALDREILSIGRGKKQLPSLLMIRPHPLWGDTKHELCRVKIWTDSGPVMTPCLGPFGHKDAHILGEWG